VDSTGVLDPRLAYASSQVLAQWGVQFRMKKLDTPMDWTPIYRSNLRDIREMAAAGVAILAGTDVPLPSLGAGVLAARRAGAAGDRGRAHPAPGPPGGHAEPGPDPGTGRFLGDGLGRRDRGP